MISVCVGNRAAFLWKRVDGLADSLCRKTSCAVTAIVLIKRGAHPRVGHLPTRMLVCLVVLLLSLTSMGFPAEKLAVPEVTALRPELEALYRDLHEHPELAFHEVRTAETLAKVVKELGFEVTTGVGGTGLVAILRNEPGPTVMLRTELDALPIEEKTGLPFASKATTRNAAGMVVPVAHSCGHDLHMTGWYGAAKIMAQRRGAWHGTLMLVGQPAEETLEGASAMLADGLFTRFPKPDYALSMHDEPSLPSGQIGFHAGYFRASVDSVEVTIFGRGGHGARPQNTIDPIVIAARVVLGLQTVVSRETDPFSPAVVTIGSIHGGNSGNTIPDEVRMQLTVRTYDARVREHALASIKRQVEAEARAADTPTPPSVKVVGSTEAVYNTPALVSRLASALARDLGTGAVREMPAKMTSEDFSRYGLAGVPAALLHIGAVNPATLASGKNLPELHSPFWAPELNPTLGALVSAEVVMLMELLDTKAPSAH
jgi:amidohydrolase